ncbi:Hsp70 family protein [Sphingomonas morindae]|uniref:Hsp70 family protein n=1 Tax=Sphingomonas morindae TaxID=1541170 RepID=A0ABY4XDQ7_9SPHN|nr:Hsp70 family protein [Sphingomonas morindae]USI74984.1 Hsp70 family protein [Sphingomonas morindae]
MSLILGLDFGTTNSVAAIAGAPGAAPALISFAGPAGTSPLFRSALCFWQEAGAPDGLAREAGPWAISEYLGFPEDSRFLQSFKSVAASASFEQASLFTRRYRFEDLGRIFLSRLAAHAGGALDGRIARLIVGRPIDYAGQRPDPALARARYDAMFAGLADEIVYVYEPLGAAFDYAAGLDRAATVLVADFGGGTSDFSVVRVAEPGAARRCRPLGHAGIGIAGDRFDYRLLDRLVLPLLGKGGQYRSFDKLLEIPRSWFSDFADWSRLALMRTPRTLAELERLRRAALDPEAIGRMIGVIEHELGYPLYEAVGQTKRALSTAERAPFRFEGGGLRIEAEVTRDAFERWIAEDIAAIEATLDRALAAAGVTADAIDRVFLTGGTSLIPRVRRLFTQRFSADRIAGGDEFTSIAQGLARIGTEADPGAWAS